MQCSELPGLRSRIRQVCLWDAFWFAARMSQSHANVSLQAVVVSGRLAAMSLPTRTSIRRIDSNVLQGAGRQHAGMYDYPISITDLLPPFGLPAKLDADKLESFSDANNFSFCIRLKASCRPK